MQFLHYFEVFIQRTIDWLLRLGLLRLFHHWELLNNSWTNHEWAAGTNRLLNNYHKFLIRLVRWQIYFPQWIKLYFLPVVVAAGGAVVAVVDMIVLDVELVVVVVVEGR